MGQMAPKDGPEILQAGRGIRRGKNDNVEQERINKIKVHKVAKSSGVDTWRDYPNRRASSTFCA